MLFHYPKYMNPEKTNQENVRETDCNVDANLSNKRIKNIMLCMFFLCYIR